MGFVYRKVQALVAHIFINGITANIFSICDLSKLNFPPKLGNFPSKSGNFPSKLGNIPSKLDNLWGSVGTFPLNRRIA